MDEPDDQLIPLRQFLTYCISCLVTLGALYGLSWTFGRYTLLATATCVLIAALPMLVFGLYVSAVRQLRNLEGFAKRGHIYRFFSGRSIRTIFWLVFAVVLAFWTLLRLHAFRLEEWLSLLILVPLVYGIGTLLYRKVHGQELKPYLAFGPTLRWTVNSSAVLMIVLMCVFYGTQIIAIEQHASFDAAEAAESARLANLQDSELTRQLAYWLSQANAWRSFLLGQLNNLDYEWTHWIGVFVLALDGLFVYGAVAGIFALVLLPAHEWRRAFGPLETQMPPDRLQLHRVTLLATFSTILILFVYLPLLAYTEAWIRSSDGQQLIASTQTNYETQKRHAVEMIADTPVEVGTVAQLIDLQTEYRARLLQFSAAAQERVDAACAEMKRNVDSFLNWYYSLGGEYARLGTLLIGELENYLQNKMTEKLGQGEELAKLEAELQKLTGDYQSVFEEYNTRREALIARNTVQAPVEAVDVTLSIESHELNLLADEQVKSLHRMAGAGAGGLAAGGIAAAITTKLVSKGVIKLASKAVLKVVTSKALGGGAGAAAGAAAGALAGSIVPGIGTAIGAAVGLGTGILVGVGIDSALLSIEEYMNRESFREEIMAEVRSTCDELSRNIPNPDSLPSMEPEPQDASAANMDL